MTPSTQPNILVVDDSPLHLRLLMDILGQQDYQVRLASGGQMALEATFLKLPDLFLLDVNMPDISGFDVCKQLKNDSRTMDIPVIFISALDEAVDRMKGFSVGGVDYITKPFHTGEVLARVKTHLNLRVMQITLKEKNQQLEHEVAERKQIEAQLRDKNRKLATLNQELDAFAHTVAHDLKNPLGAVSGYVDLILDEYQQLEPKQLESMLQQIQQASTKATSIIKELRLLASVRKQNITPKPFAMEGVVQEALDRLANKQQQCNAQIEQPATWPWAMGYAPWVEEVWVNYLSNGLKYGGSPPHLSMGATVQPDGMIRFWLRDNGPGIAAEEQHRLFTEFNRLNTTRFEGDGLGLSIIRRIIDKLGGEVGVESVLGHGSEFFFTLPQPADDME